MLNIGIAAIAAYIGAGGLGSSHSQRHHADRNAQILAVRSQSALLALVTDRLFALLAAAPEFDRPRPA